MRYAILTLLLLSLAACASRTRGPGSDCTDGAEAKAFAPNGQAAAAAADGGQKANQAPFSGEAGFAARTRTIVGRGGGATSSSSQDSEKRETASGGAQNLGLLVPATATATNQGGGVSATMAEYAAELASLRDLRAKAETVEERIALTSQIAAAMLEMGKAQASGRMNVTNTYNMGGDNTLIGVSTSKTGEQPGLDKEATGALVGGAVDIATSESSAPAAPPADPDADASGGGE